MEVPIRLSLNRSACRRNKAAVHVPACLTSAKAGTLAAVPAAVLLGEDLHVQMHGGRKDGGTEDKV